MSAIYHFEEESLSVLLAGTFLHYVIFREKFTIYKQAVASQQEC